MSDIEKIINDAWEIKDKINPDTDKNLNEAIKEMINNLNEGKYQLLNHKEMIGKLMSGFKKE